MAFLVVAAAPLRAQTSREDPVDAQGRFGAQFNLDLPSHWRSSVEIEGRMTGNVSSYRGSYFTAELGREALKTVSVFGNYRLARVGGAVFHRFGVGAEAETKGGPVSFSFRPIVQYQQKALDDDEQGATTVLRTRLQATVPASSRLALYGSLEPFFAFGGRFPIDNWRNTVGAKWKVRDGLRLDVHYIYRPDYAKIYNRTYHILGAEVSMDLKI